jgi:hypothetical protein
LQPNVSCRESYWDVGPWQVKVLAGANVRHPSVVLLSLPLRLVHQLIGPAGDCVDDVDHAHHSRAARVRGLLLWWRWWGWLGVMRLWWAAGFGHEGTNTDDCCACIVGGGGSCGAEGVYDYGGWNACAGGEGWKDW